MKGSAEDNFRISCPALSAVPLNLLPIAVLSLRIHLTPEMTVRQFSIMENCNIRLCPVGRGPRGWGADTSRQVSGSCTNRPNEYTDRLRIAARILAEAVNGSRKVKGTRNAAQS
jgi:hypothetical protein